MPNQKFYYVSPYDCPLVDGKRVAKFALYRLKDGVRRMIKKGFNEVELNQRCDKLNAKVKK
jgi:hypothetical protein